MLTSNLWVKVGLVTAAMGTVQAICKDHLTCPLLSWSALTATLAPLSLTAQYPSIPLSSLGGQCSRLQLPLKLSWAVTIHKSEGLTLDKVVIDVGKREFSTGLPFVACSRVYQLFTPPFPFQRLANLSESSRLKEREDEDRRLQSLCH